MTRALEASGGSAAQILPTWESATEPSGSKNPRPELLNGAQALVDVLVHLGVEHAFGVMGGGIAPFCRSLASSSINYVHTRHESGAAFAALEASLASNRVAVVFTTTGPGLTNALTGLAAARNEDAKVLLISAGTGSRQRGRLPCQETTAATLPVGLLVSGSLFHYAVDLEHAAELDVVARELAAGAHGLGGFVAHVCVSMDFLTNRGHRQDAIRSLGAIRRNPPKGDAATARDIARRMVSEPFFVWLGFGARRSAAAVRELVARTGAPVISSPRGKGVLPEDHPCFVGVTGLGGYGDIESTFARVRPSWGLVLGSRLGEGTSLWSRGLIPRSGLVHVDHDPSAFGAAYPDVPTEGIQSEIGSFLDALIPELPPTSERRSPRARPASLVETGLSSGPGSNAPVRPSALMRAVQRIVVEGSDATVMAESGNSFMWTTHCLRFREPGRYRVSTSYGSMGHMATGVLGAAMASGKKAVAIVGDGAMLMLSEVNTAVRHRTPAVWIVLNDACYGMVEQGIRSLGWETWANDIPRVDFAALAVATGAEGLRVDREDALDEALRRALATDRPVVVDVRVDPSELAPSVANRARSLEMDGGGT